MYETSDKNLYLLSHDGHLSQTNFEGETRERLSLEAINIKKEAQYQIYVMAENVLLLENDILYFFNKERKEESRLVANR